MKKITLSLLALSGALVFQSCSVNKKVAHTEHTSHAGHHHHEEHGISLEYMDTNVRPQDDFYNFVNGGWMRTAVIPSDKASWGSFNELREKTDEASLTILKNILSETYAEGTEGKNPDPLRFFYGYG